MENVLKATDTLDDSSLRHKHLGHFSYSTLKQIGSNELVENLSTIKDNIDVCGACQYKKNKYFF
ncbi:hypothetical protein CR513_03163, partial [Mucuna pruriens]